MGWGKRKTKNKKRRKDFCHFFFANTLIYGSTCPVGWRIRTDTGCTDVCGYKERCHLKANNTGLVRVHQ